MVESAGRGKPWNFSSDSSINESALRNQNHRSSSDYNSSDSSTNESALRNQNHRSSSDYNERNRFTGSGHRHGSCTRGPDTDIVGFSTEIIYLHNAQHGPRTGPRTARTGSELRIHGRSSRTDPVPPVGDSRGSRRVHLVFLTGEISVHRTQHVVLNFGTIHSGTTTLSGEY